jgi:hypothetical protein
MKKILINECLDCPYIMPTRYDMDLNNPAKAFCRKKGARAILSLDAIPDWCPLPDEKDSTVDMLLSAKERLAREIQSARQQLQ